MLKMLRLICLTICIGCCSTAFAQVDIFIKFAGINGTSSATGFTAYSEVEQTGLANTSCTTSGNSNTTCQGVPGNFNFQMILSEVAPQLQNRLFLGTVINTVDVVFRKASGSATTFVFYQIHLEGVRVASIAEVASGTGVPAEQYALAFQKIAWKYTTQTSTGATGPSTYGCWDFITRTGATNCASTYTFPF